MHMNNIRITGKVNFKLIFNFYFLNMNISLNIVLIFTKLSTSIGNILIQGTMSQNFDLGISSNFMTKNGLLLSFS